MWRLRRKQRVNPRQDDYQLFGYVVLMANPPFAGDIKQSDMLSPYDLAHKKTGELERAVGRDLLFIERNLDFLKSGGRMAVVLRRAGSTTSPTSACASSLWNAAAYLP